MNQRALLRAALPFVPYAVIAIVHLTTLVVHSDAGSSVTKLLLMPALLGALLVGLRGVRTKSHTIAIALCAVLGILFSWGGDALIESPGDIGFLLGLGCFLLAHLAYLVLFLRPPRAQPLRVGAVWRLPKLALLYLLWWVVLLLSLTPHIGALLIPVAVYGLVLAASSSAALGVNRFAATGALVFLCSDTILAFKLFFPHFTFWQIDAAIMLLYILGQGLIAYSSVARASAGSEIVSREALSPARTSPTQPLR